MRERRRCDPVGNYGSPIFEKGAVEIGVGAIQVVLDVPEFLEGATVIARNRQRERRAAAEVVMRRLVELAAINKRPSLNCATEASIAPRSGKSTWAAVCRQV